MKKLVLFTAVVALFGCATETFAQCDDLSDVARFSSAAEQTIIDYKHGLMWSACAISPSSGRCMGETEVRSRMTGLQALQFAEDAQLGGHADWRLPNLKEALTLFGGCNDFTYQAPLQAGKYQRRIWTATLDAGLSGASLKTVTMSDGQIVPWAIKTSAASVFLVRDVAQGAQ